MKKIVTFWVFVFLIGCGVQAAFAQGVVRHFQTKGNSRIEPETIYSYLAVQEGEPVTEEAIDKSVKALFSTGLFADVNISVEGDLLMVRVVENPVVNQIYFEGNDKLDEKTLTAEIQLKPRGVYTKAKIRSDTERMLELYRSVGRFNATISPKIIEREHNRVDVVFEIDEGKPAYVRKISFLGNKEFSDDDLKDKLITKEKKWYRFFSSTDTYDPQRLEFDQHLLRSFYLSRGYINFQVEDVLVELAPDKQSFLVTFDIREGHRYRVAEVGVSSSLPKIDKKDLVKLIEVKTEKYYSSKDIDSTLEAMTDFLGQQGYAFVEIEPRLSPDEKNKTVKVGFEVKESERVFINRINIIGNTRTLDKVIRREMRLQEGDAFNGERLRKSKQNIENLGYFSKVEMDTKPVDGVADKTDIVLNVQEKPTGSLSFGVGWSTYDGALLDIGIQERNLLGKGYILGASASISESDIVYDISFTDPYFLDYNLSFGVNLFHIQRDYKNTSSYDSEMNGGTLNLGWDWTDYLSQSTSYTLQQDRISNVDSDASLLIKEQEGSSIVSMIGQTLTYDRRDNRFNPTEGYVLTLGTDLAGIGGDTRFARVTMSAVQYFSLWDEFIVSFSGTAGYIKGIGQNLLISNRFFLGGGNLRGFESGGVGAVTKYNDDFLGGDWRATASAQLTFPLGLPKEVGLTGKVFVDTGVLGRPVGLDKSQYYYSSKPRMSIGFGLIWRSPMGPINIDWGFPVIKEKYDKKEIFRLNFGTGF